MRVCAARAVVAAMILGCCASAQAKKHTQKEDPLAHKAFNAPAESVYTAAVAVAGKQWQVVSSDPAAHSLSFATTNTRLENAGGYSTYTVLVTCVAAPAGGTAVNLDVTEHGSDQPSLMALMNKSQRRIGILQDFWDGVEAALKESAPPQAAPTVQSIPAATPAAPPPGPPPSPRSSPPPTPMAPSKSAPAAAPVVAPGNAAQPAVTPEQPPVAPPRTPKPSARGELAVVAIKSTPEGAAITIEGKYFGDTPTTARLPAGDYPISIERAGYKPWKQTVTLTEGGTVTLDATLEGAQ
jgi:hypothetical protein